MIHKKINLDLVIPVYGGNELDKKVINYVAAATLMQCC